jgi:hypothetical protein
LIITGDSDADIFDLKKFLKQKFEMKDLGELHYFFGIEVIQSPRGIWLLQRQYALNKLSKYGMMGCKPISIPLEQNVKLNADEGNLVEGTTMYKHIVGSLIYMTIIKPYLSYAIGVVSQFMQTPQKPHLDAMRRILRYIKLTLQCGIFYETKSQLQVHGYTNVDWVGNVLDRRSTSGFMFSFGSGAVSWCRNPSFGLATKAKGLQGCGPKGSPGVTSGTPRSVGKREGVNPHTPKATPALGDGVPVDSQNFRDRFEGSNLNGLWRSLYQWKSLEA